MLRNVGREDRVVRIVIAIALGALVYLGTLSGTASIVALVIAAVLLLTGLFARCPFYKMLDIDTSVQEQSYSTTDDRAFDD
jgi:ABC-type siderophore export system fused ATPase/permease subunit